VVSRILCGFILTGALAPAFAIQVTESRGHIQTQTSGTTEIYKTDATASAQLNLDAKNVVRLGANSELRIAQDGSITFFKGSALFDLNRPLAVQSGKELISLKRGVGFVRIIDGADEEKSIVVGALASKISITTGKSSVSIHAGELVSLDEQNKGTTASFDLQKMVATSSLLANFKTPLPHRSELDREARRFASLRARGFIRPQIAGTSELVARNNTGDFDPSATMVRAIPTRGIRSIPPSTTLGFTGWHPTGPGVIVSGGSSTTVIQNFPVAPLPMPIIQPITSGSSGLVLQTISGGSGSVLNLSLGDGLLLQQIGGYHSVINIANFPPPGGVIISGGLAHFSPPPPAPAP